MTEISHILTFPIKKATRPYENRIQTMENLINLDNRLKKEGSKNGIYNKRCMITIDDRDNPVAICRVTTYGDIDWLKKEIDKEPFIKKRPLIEEFDVSEEELITAKRYMKMYD